MYTLYFHTRHRIGETHKKKLKCDLVVYTRAKLIILKFALKYFKKLCDIPQFFCYKNILKLHEANICAANSKLIFHVFVLIFFESYIKYTNILYICIRTQSTEHPTKMNKDKQVKCDECNKVFSVKKLLNRGQRNKIIWLKNELWWMWWQFCMHYKF